MPRSNRQNFIVTCHGWSASNWLAYSLNRHPDITCGHSSAAIPAEDPSIFDKDGLKAHIPQLRKGYVQRQTRPMAEIYAELHAHKTAPYAGTVHTYRLRDLPVQQEAFPDPGQRFRTVNLVRHPLDLVISGYGQFQDLFKIDLNEFSWTLNKVVHLGLDIIDPLCDRHGIAPGEYDTLCFFGACVVMNSLALDLDALQQIRKTSDSPWDLRGIVRMEDVTRDPDTLAELIERLTGQAGLASADYLDNVYRQGRINVHNHSASDTTEHRWHELADWQKQAFATFLRRFDLQPAYEEYGYDFSFTDGWDMQS